MQKITQERLKKFIYLSGKLQLINHRNRTTRKAGTTSDIVSLQFVPSTENATSKANQSQLTREGLTKCPVGFKITHQVLKLGD